MSNIDEILKLLNDALALDANAVTKLFNYRVPCNDSLGDHPTIIVGRWPMDGSWPSCNVNEIDAVPSETRVGILGLLNGLLPGFDIYDERIAANYADDGHTILSFGKYYPAVADGVIHPGAK